MDKPFGWLGHVVYVRIPVLGKGESNLTCVYMDVSKNSDTPKSSILIGFSIINHPFCGTTIFGNTHIFQMG